MTTKRERKQELYAIVADSIVLQETFTRRPNVCVAISVEIGEQDYDGVGFAKVRWPDKWDEAYGVRMALDKAVMQVVKEIMNGEDDETIQ